MLKRFRFSTVLTILNCCALIIIFALAFKEFAVPKIAVALYGKQYKELVFRCDNVMREHLIAKNGMLSAPSDDAVRTLKASEVGLIECDDYDMMRKKLLSMGVTEADLGRLGLETIEERAKDVRAFVETHQIKY